MDKDHATATQDLQEENTPRVRIHAGPANVTLVYLPGVHGDWTLVGGFRRAVLGRVRLVEVCYPRTRNWSLEEYAAQIQKTLGDAGISRGWLLGESFGSQVVWELLRQNRFQVDGVILAGGFVRHPAPWMATLAALCSNRLSLALLRGFLFLYMQSARWRFRHSPETMIGLEEFAQRRTPSDWQAARHRLRLVAQNDPRDFVRRLSVPVYAVTGLFDPIVPWGSVRRWLRRYYQALGGHRVLWRADHNVLGTAPRTAAACVLGWLKA